MYFSAVLSYLLVIIKEVLTVIKSDVFTIRTEGCSIAAFPKVSESIKTLVGPPQTPQTCSTAKQLVSANTSHIWVIQEALSSYNVYKEEIFYCCYRHFSALSNISNITYGNCKEFSTIIRADHEFVRVECFYLDDKIYDDFFLFSSHEAIPPTSHDKESYNILIIGIESMSRLNFHRTMPLTAGFLKDKGIVELLGYNKLGDNSFPNLIPVLTGLSFDNVKKTCINGNNINFNNCEIIWNKFKEKGYYTALGSDSIAGLLGTYEYSLPRIPTHFYLQPFIFETRNLFKNQHYNFHQCMGSQFFYDILLNYIYGLTQKLKRNKFFGMFWEESISHEDLNKPHVMDESYYTFLNKLDKDKYLNNTILIMLSDHGMRWGKIVRTEQGRLEERLPLLGILLPDRFKRRYKLAYKNILQNANRLTTPFDIHKTLLDLLNPRSLEDYLIMERNNKRIRSENIVYSESSLFIPVSAKRNCSSVGIEEHWCACRKGKKIKIGNNKKSLAAHNLVAHINEQLNSYPQCRKLDLAHIYDVSLIEINKQWRIYKVMVKTEPGGGIFDGTLIQDAARWVVSGTVSRLNLYRDQSDCVDDAAVKMYCFCG